MDNVNQPPGHDPQGHEPTQPFRFTPGWPAAAAGGGQPASGYGQVPPEYGQVPPGYGPVPPGFGQASPEYGQAPPGSGQASPEYGQAPPGSGQVPPGYGQGTPGQPGQPGGPYGSQRARPRRRALRWGAGISAAVLLGAGGAMAGLQLAGHASVPANSTQATALNNALSPAGSAACRAAAGSSSGGQASGQAGQPGQAGQARLRCHPHRLRLLRLVRGMYGEVAFYTQHGTETLAFERGTIESVSGGSVVVRARNGTTWTWSLASDSIIRKQGRAATSSDLSRGERVFVGGQVTGGTRDIRLILIRGQLSPPAAQPGSQGSSSSGSSSSPSGTWTLPPH
jgi:hypothetical protein